VARLGAHGAGDPLGPLDAIAVISDRLADLRMRHEVDSPEALHRLLVVDHRLGRETLADGGCRLFMQAHAEDEEGIAESVLLLCTDRRWRGVERRLLLQLSDCPGVEDCLELLALVFLQASSAPVTVPGSWLLDLYAQVRDGEVRGLDPAKSYSIDRPIPPQLRRWASARTATSDDGIRTVLRRALGSDSRVAAALIHGLVDAAEHSDEQTKANLLDIGLDWPSPAVRLAALQGLARSGRTREAAERARRDAAAAVRAWGVKLEAEAAPTPAVSPDGDSQTTEADRSSPREEQLALF
jgi:hypothetical protein